MPVVSITSVMVLHTLLNISLSHFIDEQDGSKEANDSIGFSFSTLLASAIKNSNNGIIVIH